MSGNAAEWCQDDYHPSHAAADWIGSVLMYEPPSTWHVTRGGRAGDNPSACRSAARQDLYKGNSIGFRVMKRSVAHRDFKRIALTSPTFAAPWEAGTEQTIGWQYRGQIGDQVSARLYDGDLLMREIGSVDLVLTDTLDPCGTLTWSIPANYPLGDEYHIRVVSLEDETVYGESEAFSITDIPVDYDAMISIPAGTFEMGIPGNTDGREPVHSVTLSAYEIGQYEVTNQQFADALNWANGQGYFTTVSSSTVVAYRYEMLDIDSGDCQIYYEDGSFFVASRNGYSMANHPVTDVSWHGAAAYCNWLSEMQRLSMCYNRMTWECDMSKSGYHLPTEAQWERAAAWDGARNQRFGYGSDDLQWPLLNHDWRNPLRFGDYPRTMPTGSFYATSPVGCYDMSGNVWEWCTDWYDWEYYLDSPSEDPQGPDTGEYHLIRGGGWASETACCTTRYRARGHSDAGHPEIGFRVAR